jgi:branched-chain amino acid transport system substrate-binding protein
MKLPNILIAIIGFILTGSSSVAEPIKIGIIIPLTGGLSEYGMAFQNGVKLAEEIDKGISQKIRFLIEDSQYDNRQALTAFDKLSGPEKCPIVFVWGSGPSEAIAPLAQRKHLPLITLGEHTAAVGRPNVITFTNPSSQFTSSLAKVLQGRGYKKLALVMTQITYFETLSTNLKDSLASDQELNVIGTYQPTDNDFKTTVIKLKAAHADAVGIYLLNGQVSQFYKQMKSQNIELPTFGTDIFESSSEIKNSEPTIEGALYAHNVVIDKFRKRYISTYGTDVQLPTAARGYDFANLVANLAASLPPEPGNELLRRLEQTPPQQGASGEFKFVNSPVYGKHFEFPVAVKEIRNGGPKIVTE